MTALSYLLLFAIGCVAGTLNVLAGGGSFLTLPALVFFGLPAGVANATNRVGIVLQNMAAAWSFRRQGVHTRGAFVWAALPALLGGTVGAGLALFTSDELFQRILAVLMVVFAVWSLASRRGTTETSADPRGAKLALIAAGFFGAGVYAGFVQAGVGFLILALTTAAGLDLVRGNAVKVTAIFVLTVAALAIFTWQGKVDWALGLALGSGNLAGGLVGARLTVLKGHDWVRRFVVVTLVVFALKLWLDT